MGKQSVKEEPSNRMRRRNRMASAALSATQGNRCFPDGLRLIGKLASGGMGSVVLAQRTCSGDVSSVAVKRPHRRLGADGEPCQDFAHEARLSLLVRHPNVVAAQEFIQAQGNQCLVMDYVEGESLAALLRSRSELEDPIPCSVVVGIIGGALRGLHAAHEATDETGTPLELVHRDVSPQNIIVGTDGVARLADFGIATIRGGTRGPGAHKTQGKPNYMAPEQLRGEFAVRRSDVYAMGVVLWEMLTGRKLFARTGLSLQQAESLARTPPPPSHVEPTVSPELDEVVMRAIAFDPRHRFRNAQEMLDALETAVKPCKAAVIGNWVFRQANECIQARRRMCSTGVPSGATVAKQPSRWDEEPSITLIQTVTVAP